MTADPSARLDAAYLLGALDADERLAYEAHLPPADGANCSSASSSTASRRRRDRVQVPDSRAGTVET